MYASAGGARPRPATKPAISPMPIRSTSFNLNENPNPNYYPGILMDDLFPKGCSYENTYNCWSTEPDIPLPLPRSSCYRYGWSGFSGQPWSPNMPEIPYSTIWGESVNVQNGTTPYNISPIESRTTPYSISKESDLSEKLRTCNISGASCHVENGVAPYLPLHNPLRKSMLGGTDRELFYLHEETEEGRNSRKGELEANNNQRAHLEQVEVANQFKSDEHAEHKFTSVPHAIDASIHADIVGEIGSSVLMPEAAPLSAILEALRRLSGNLLSPDFDSVKLKGHDHELLRLLIDNLVAFAMRNKKDVNKRNAHDSRPIAGLNSDFGGKQKHNSCNRDEMMHSVTLEMLKEELGLSDDHSSSDLCNHENVVKAQVYKKLWIEAEAALCIMKLQFAQIEISGESHYHQTEGNLQQSSEVSSPEDSMYYKHEAPIITKKKNPVAAEDASAQAGLKVLKDRDNIANATEKNIELIPAKIVMDRLLTLGNQGAANSSDLELSEDTFYTDMNRSEINDSIGNNDEEKEGLDFFVSSSDEELDSCTKKPNSGDEGNGFYSDWELV